MMKNLLFSLFLSMFISIVSVYSQSLQTVNHSKGFDTKLGGVGGTERYTYYVGSRGEQIPQGSYSFSGTKKLSNQESECTINYNISTGFVNGRLNGNFSVTGKYNGKNYYFTRGWVPYTNTSKLVGVFREGKPFGEFSASMDFDVRLHANLVMKEGKYIGSYSYYGYSNSGRLVELRGTLASNGALTGRWLYDDMICSTTMTFQNDVLISKSSANGSTSPAVEEIARKYAAGQLTEEQVRAKGYFFGKDSLPLDAPIWHLFLNDEYNLKELPGKCDFSDYRPKEYTEIVELNMLSQEGLSLVLNQMRSKNRPYPEYEIPAEDLSYGQDGYVHFCLSQDPTYGTFYLSCGNRFAERYGTLAHKEDRRLFLTDYAKEQFKSLQDSLIISKAVPMYSLMYNRLTDWQQEEYANYMAIELFSEYLKEPEMGIIKAINEMDRFQKEYLKSLLLSEFMDATQVENGKYILMKRDEYPGLELVACDNKLEELQQFVAKMDSLFSLREKSVQIARQILNSQNINPIIDKIVTCYAQYYHKLSFSSIQKLNNSVNNGMSLSKDIMHNDTILRKSLNKQMLKGYSSLMTNISKRNLNDTISLYKFIAELHDFKDLQEGYCKLVEKQNKVISNNEKIEEQLASYGEILKVYRKEYSLIDFKPSIAGLSSMLSMENIYDTFIKRQNDIEAYVGLRKTIDEKHEVLLKSLNKNLQRQYSTLYTTAISNTIFEKYPETKSDLEYFALIQDGYNSWQLLYDSVCSVQNSIMIEASPYKDIIKAEKSKEKQMDVLPSLSSIEETKKAYEILHNEYDDRVKLKKYVENRKTIDSLILESKNILQNHKNVLKALNLIVKDLIIEWDESSTQNYDTAEDNISLLSQIKTNILSADLDTLNVDAKKIKTSQEALKLLGVE